MVFLAVFLFLCSGFFFFKGMRENSNNDRLMALILLIVALFALFTGIASLRVIGKYGV